MRSLADLPLLRAEIERVLMPLDATYDQLMRLLSARGLEWVRQRVIDLPDPLAVDHPAVAALTQAGRMAPVLSGLRGHMSPLEDIATRRLTVPLVLAASARWLDGDRQSGLSGTILAGRLVAQDHALWQLAMADLAEDAAAPLADRLAAAGRPDATLRAQAEAVICQPVPEETITAAHVDAFTRVVMQLYEFGALRPQFSHPRLYGEAFAKLMRFADWSRRRGSIVAMAQTGYCLRLIDADHDISALLAEIIACQRPDGSFPDKAGYSTRDQDLDAGIAPTLMVLAVLNMAAWRRWRGPLPARRETRPFTACRDLFAGVIAAPFEAWASAGPTRLRLRLATAMSRATSENWFLRYGLRRVAPSREEVLDLSRGLFGDAYAARHARKTLDLERHWPQDLEMQQDGPALRWLRGAPVKFTETTAGLPATSPFDLRAQGAAMRDDDWRRAARGAARQALLAVDLGDALSPDDAIAHLERLCVMAQLIEGEAALAAAA